MNINTKRRRSSATIRYSIANIFMIWYCISF